MTPANVVILETDAFRIWFMPTTSFHGFEHKHCGSPISWNDNDVKNLYCGKCHVFLLVETVEYERNWETPRRKPMTGNISAKPNKK